MRVKMSDTERQKHLLRFVNPNPRAKQRVIGVPVGLPSAKGNEIAFKCKAIFEDIARASYDVQGNRNFGPVEKGERLRQTFGARAKELEALGKDFRAERNRVRRLVTELDPVKPYEQLPAHHFQLDLYRLKKFNAAPPKERATLIHQIRVEPELQLSLAEAFARLPADVTGLDWNLRNEIRVGLIQLLRNEAYENLDLQMNQLELAGDALKATVDLALELTGTTQDVLTHAPETFAVTLGEEKDDRLYWVKPQANAADIRPLGAPPIEPTPEVQSA